MIKFKLKNNSNTRNNIAMGLSAAGLAVSLGNLRENSKNRKQGREDRKELTEVLKKLNNTLTKVDQHYSSYPRYIRRDEEGSFMKPSKSTLGDRIKGIFRLKNNSYTTNGALAGAAMGASIASSILNPLSLNGRNAYLPFLTNADYTAWNNKNKRYETRSSPELGLKNKLITALSGALVGAALGAIVGGIKDAAIFRDKRNTNKRLSVDIIENLNRLGFKKDTNYTLDPKMANLMKTKICVAISRVNGDLKLVINTVNDPKLKLETDLITKNLPKSSMVTEKLGDRFNELSITTLSNKDIDPALVTGILELFIRRGYPVYIVEVG